MRRITLPLSLLVVLPLALMAACSSDDSTSSTTTSSTTSTTSADQAYCADSDQLKTDIDALKDLDVVADGTTAVTSQLDTIKSDVTALKDSAGDVAATEISTLETSLDDVQSSLSAVSGDLTVANHGRRRRGRRGGRHGRRERGQHRRLDLLSIRPSV